ncbi:WD40 repeat-like protein, partial [Stereum hirsutum FP-91666 SS1]|uniref:WD40 repeat-like protein n=1 Tax=Stereum hirsutum (strain FP-91666) TaxID=721885 RepID=UPI00044498D9
LKGHTAMVGAVTFSQHGNLIASGSHDTSIRLWDATTGRERVTLQGEKIPVLSLAFSNAKEDLMLASGSSNNTICLWRVQTATTILTFEGHEDGVVALAFAPNDGHIVSGSFDKTIRVWSTKTGKAIGEPLIGHTDTVSSVGFSYDAKWIISGSFDRTIRIWEGQTSEEKQFVEIYKFEPNHGDWIGSAALLPGGEYIVSASLNGTYQSRNIEKKVIERKPFLGHSAASRCARFSPDGKCIVSCSDDGTIRFWDTETALPLFKPQWHKGNVYHVEYLPDGKKLFSAGADWTVQLWNAQDGTMDGEAFRGHSTVVRAVAHSPETNQLASGSDDGTIRVWNLDISDGGDRLAFPAWEDAGTTQSIDFSLDGDHIVSGLEDGRVRLWSTVKRAAVHEWKGTEGRVYSVKFCPDGRSIVAGATDGTIHVWDFKGNLRGKFRGHSGPVFTISFSPRDSNRLVSGSADQSIIIWDFATREKIGEPWREHNGAVWSVAFSPDGKEIVSASEDSTIRIWDVASGRPVSFPPPDLPTTGHQRLSRRDRRDITLPDRIDWGLLGIGAKDLVRLATWMKRSLASQLWSMVFDLTD